MYNDSITSKKVKFSFSNNVINSYSYTLFLLFMRNIILVFLLFIFQYSKAQEFGGEPASVKWKQVNTDTVRIIFPAGMDSIAKRIASITSKEQQQYTGTIGNRLHKVNIVLHNQTTFSNGFVSLAPWRSEFFSNTRTKCF